MRQPALFPESVERSLRLLPVIGEQHDITYYGTRARTVLNGPGTTGMSYWSINPYVGCAFGCAYCYARYAHRYVMERATSADRLDDRARHDAGTMPPWLAFERHIFVKRNAPDVLRGTLRFGSDRHRALLDGEAIVIGTATDPYQPAERRFRITRDLLETLAQHAGLTIVIITKSPLITRDVDVLSRIARHSTISVRLSLITVDRGLARRLEPRAPTPESRLRAVRRLREAGVEVGINCMPVLPGITDDPHALDALVRRIADAGAMYAGVCALRLRHEARKRYLPFIEQEFPHLADRYRRVYAEGHKMPERYRTGLEAFFARLCRRYGLRHWTGAEDDMPPAPDTQAEVRRETSEQLHLALG
jgi:DNA repair photolyase